MKKWRFFYRFNAKNWHVRQILHEKVAFFFTDLMRKFGVFGVNFILQKFCPCKKNDKYQVCLNPPSPPCRFDYLEEFFLTSVSVVKVLYIPCPESEKPRQRVSASAMLTGKFLQIRKVFVTSSLLAEELRILCNTKYPDNMQSVRMNWKVSGQSKKCTYNLENVSG